MIYLMLFIALASGFLMGWSLHGIRNEDPRRHISSAEDGVQVEVIVENYWVGEDDKESQA